MECVVVVANQVRWDEGVMIQFNPIQSHFDLIFFFSSSRLSMSGQTIVQHTIVGLHNPFPPVCDQHSFVVLYLIIIATYPIL